MKEIDARGLSCPEPVLRARKELQELPPKQTLTVLVDTVTARENVSRTARSLGFEVKVDEVKGDYSISISKGDNS